MDFALSTRLWHPLCSYSSCSSPTIPTCTYRFVALLLFLCAPLYVWLRHARRRACRYVQPPSAFDPRSRHARFCLCTHRDIHGKARLYGAHHWLCCARRHGRGTPSSLAVDSLQRTASYAISLSSLLVALYGAVYRWRGKSAHSDDL